MGVPTCATLTKLSNVDELRRRGPVVIEPCHTGIPETLRMQVAVSSRSLSVLRPAGIAQSPISEAQVFGSHAASSTRRSIVQNFSISALALSATTSYAMRKSSHKKQRMRCRNCLRITISGSTRFHIAFSHCVACCSAQNPISRLVSDMEIAHAIPA